MFMPAWRMIEVLLAPNYILRKTAGSKNNSARCRDFHLALLGIGNRPDDAAGLIGFQFGCRRPDPDRNLFVEAGFCEPRNQRISVHEPHRPSVKRHVTCHAGT